MSAGEGTTPPILADKHHDNPSAFTPESLLREARRQKGAEAVAVSKVCLLDPDGDIVCQLRAEGRVRRHDGWVCYHTEMWVFDLDGHEIGVVGCAVGASFAVLVAEEMFASGCELLISVTSSGQITPQGALRYFILIDRALRDEGTSYHYLPPSDWSAAPEQSMARLNGAFEDGPACSSARPGQPMLRSARRRPPSLWRGRVAFWRSRWKRQRSTLLPRPVGDMIERLARDYDNTRAMIFGDDPNFDDVLASIGLIGDLLNER